MSMLDSFLEENEEACYIKDYGHGVLPFKRLVSIYGNWYFVVIEMTGFVRLETFYFRGSLDAFKKRCENTLTAISNEYFSIFDELRSGLKVFSVGYVPALFTVDFSKDEIADAIRRDFVKHGFASYDTGYNLLEKICQGDNYFVCAEFNCAEFKRAKNLDFDYFTWCLKHRL